MELPRPLFFGGFAFVCLLKAVSLADRVSMKIKDSIYAATTTVAITSHGRIALAAAAVAGAAKTPNGAQRSQLCQLAMKHLRVAAQS